MNNEQIQRRKLLKCVAYTPPAILGVVLMPYMVLADPQDKRFKKCSSGTIIISANGNACCPCIEFKSHSKKDCKKARKPTKT